MKAMKRLGAALLSLTLLAGTLTMPAAAQENAPVSEPGVSEDFTAGLENGFVEPPVSFPPQEQPPSLPETGEQEEDIQPPLPEEEAGTATEEGPAVTLGDEPGSTPDEKPGDTPEDKPEEPVDPNAPLFPLKTDQHVVYIGGHKDKFNPDDNLTRAEAAKIIHFLLAAPAEPGENQFPDVPNKIWFADYVNSLARMGILQGENGKFQPDRNITRAEFATIVTRLYPADPGEQNFTDVSKEYWGAAAIATASKKGWVNGYSDGSFRPEEKIKRCEAVTIVNRMLGRTADKAAIDNVGKILQFIDLSYDHWAYYQVMEASVMHSYEKDAAAGTEKWLNFQPMAASHDVGYHNIDGELYYVNNNRRFVRNETIGVLQFNNYGKYTTGSSQLDAALTEIVRDYTDPEDDRYTKLYSMYRYVMEEHSYLMQAFIPEGAVGWEPEWAMRMISMGRGNCYSYAALYAMLARKLGYQAVGVSGMITAIPLYGEDWTRHGWVEITEGGRTYFNDPEFEGVYCWNRGIDWNLFMGRYEYGPTSYMVNGYWK